MNNALANRRPVSNQLSADPRYRMSTPPKPQGPGLDQSLLDAASEAAPAASQFLGGLRSVQDPSASQSVNALLRSKQLQSQLDNDPDYQAWKLKARAAGANQMASGDAFPRGVEVPTMRGPAGLSMRPDVVDANRAALARIRERGNDRQDFYDNRAQGIGLSRAVSSPQGITATLLGKLAQDDGGGDGMGMSNMLRMSGNPQAMAMADALDRNRNAGLDRDARQGELRWQAYNTDLQQWMQEDREYKAQVAALRAQGRTPQQAAALLAEQGIILRPRPTEPGAMMGGMGAPLPQQGGSDDGEGQTQAPRATGTLFDQTSITDELLGEDTKPEWLLDNWDRLDVLDPSERDRLLKGKFTTEQIKKIVSEPRFADGPHAKIVKELARIYGIPHGVTSDNSRGTSWMEGDQGFLGGY